MFANQDHQQTSDVTEEDAIQYVKYFYKFCLDYNKLFLNLPLTRKCKIVTNIILTLKRKNAKKALSNVLVAFETSLIHWKIVNISACQIKVCKT